jgi:hypothetical protein
MTGTLSQRGTSPLNFRRPTKQTAWLDPSPHTVQVNAFGRGVPSARVVVLHDADHYVFKSDEAGVLRDVRAFIDGLHTSP